MRTMNRWGRLMRNIVQKAAMACIMLGCAASTASAQSPAEMQDRAQTWFHEAWTAARELPDTKGHVFRYSVIDHTAPNPDVATLKERLKALPPGPQRAEVEAMLASYNPTASLFWELQFVGEGETRWRASRADSRGYSSDHVYSPDATWVLMGSRLSLLNTSLRDNDMAPTHGVIIHVRTLFTDLSDLFWGGLGSDRIWHGLRLDPLTLNGTEWTVVARSIVGDKTTRTIEYKGDWHDSRGVGTVRQKTTRRNSDSSSSAGVTIRYTRPTVCPRTGLLTYELVERLGANGEVNFTLRSKGFHEVPGGAAAAFVPPTDGQDALRGTIDGFEVFDRTKEHNPDWMTRPANYLPPPTLSAAREAAANLTATNARSTSQRPAALPQTEDPVGGGNMLMFIALGVVVLGVVVLIVLKVRGGR